MELITKLDTKLVVRYHTSWFDNNRIFIQMELCHADLENIIKQKEKAFSMTEQTSTINPIDYFISTELLIELLEGVNYLHSLNPPIIHRDLKPQNILISLDNCDRFLKICDFGISVLNDKTIVTTINAAGTPGYIAPELFNGRYDTKADIYSLGMIAYELVFYDK